MPTRFKQLSLAEFIAVLDRFPFTRHINAVHMHHTWRPNRAQYQGLASIEAMWQYHTQHNGWSDIAQHITIAPDGTIWTGRNWNLAPASSSGHNGNSLAGPFMFEMIGDFDKGRDPFDGAQRNTALHVVAHVLHKFKLPNEALHFHNQMSVKTCPGSSISYANTLVEVQKIRATLGTRTVNFGAVIDSERIERALELLRRVPIASHTRRLGAEALAEPAEEGMSRQEMHHVTDAPETTTSRNAPLREALSEAQKRRLRPHVINLDQGHFSPDGLYTTRPADVDAIFDRYLEQALQEAKAANRPLQIMLYAHGGLVSEKSGLQSALRYIPWWLQNHVYPLYFVWETGLCGTLGAIIRSVGSREAARGITDLTDRIVEKSVGPLGGQLWKNMKDSAEWAAAADGGARYVALKLKAFCDAHGNDVRTGALQLHAAGHSAGSIFHAHFIPVALQLGVPAFRTLHLLAPAIRVDEFKRHLAAHVGKGIQHLTLYTMRDALELADTCSLIYRKSLLYLLYYALETARETPILGLDISLHADAQLQQLLGLSGTPTPNAEVIWSKTLEPTHRSSSTSTSHGGFDDDAPTMESVLRRVTNQEPVAPFPTTRELVDPWHEPVELPEELVLLAQVQAETKVPTPKKPAKPAPLMPLPSSNGHARQRALCIGIDEYAAAPLSGCVADAQSWVQTLQKFGFETATLLDSEATRANMLDRITKLVNTSKPGDVVVIQYSGHGTTLKDLDGDEEDDGRDEALCPYDYATGAFLLDDDLRAVFRRVPTGVNVTLFMDCCHSGTISRFATLEPVVTAPSNSRPRFMRATRDMEAAHEDFRRTLANNGLTSPADGSRAHMRVVTFTACQPIEVAYETDGSGDFTNRAVRLLSKATTGVTHKEFQRQVTRAFGAKPRQHPTLDCTDDASGYALLQPVPSVSSKVVAPKPARRKKQLG
ncbi:MULTISPECIES: caspase family protein [Hymenobacter]|nr:MULTISPECIES: caspase family protein [Hymenobacter]MBC6989869.1 caspase family protein [Hymenobacter sp. BT491]